MWSFWKKITYFVRVFLRVYRKTANKISCKIYKKFSTYILLVASGYNRLRASYKRETKQQSECWRREASDGSNAIERYFQIYKPSLDAFCPFGLISRACHEPRDPPIALTLPFIKQTNTTHKTYVPFIFERGSFRRSASHSTMD